MNYDQLLKLASDTANELKFKPVECRDNTRIILRALLISDKSIADELHPARRCSLEDKFATASPTVGD